MRNSKSTDKQRSRAIRMAAFLWSLWWWLPPRGRRQLFALARRHGPWLVQREFSKRKRRKSRKH